MAEALLAFSAYWLVGMGMFLVQFCLAYKFRNHTVEHLRGAIACDEEQYNPLRDDSPLLVCIVGPIVEEAIFRLPPILCFLRLGWSWGAVAVLVSSVVFAVLHLFEVFGQYEDGTPVRRPIPVILRILAVSLLYGSVAIVMKSIVPCAIAHIIWNTSTYTSHNPLHDYPMKS